MVVSKAHNNRPIEDFILVSPAPVDTAAKLSNIYMVLSTKVSYSSQTPWILAKLTVTSMVKKFPIF
jgi:uncharacterized membrane protein SirB2